MAVIASALFIDGKLDRWLADHWAKRPCFQLLSVQDGEAVASGKTIDLRPVWAEMAFLEPRYHQELFRNPNSLLGRIISLITCSNSLQASKNFPVRMPREIARKALIEMPIP